MWRPPGCGYSYQFLNLERFWGTLGTTEAAEILGRILELADKKIFLGGMGIKDP